MKNNTKPCPKCKTKVAKDLGCLKMHCSKCGTEFCWKCLCTPYHGKNASGGYFRCEVAETKLKRRNSFEKGEDRAKIKLALRAQEYNETFSKFLDCKATARNAKSNLKVTVEKIKSEILSSVRTFYSSKATHSYHSRNSQQHYSKDCTRALHRRKAVLLKTQKKINAGTSHRSEKRHSILGRRTS